MNLIRTPEIKESSSWRGRHANILLVKVIIALKWLLTSVPASDLFCDIFLIYSPFVRGLGFVMAQFRIAFVFLSTSSIRYGRKTSKNPSLSYSLKTQPIKKQTYLVSLPHLLDRSCHSQAGSWPQVAPLYSAPQASPRYLLSVIRVLISSVHTVRPTTQTQVAGFIASTHLSELFKLPRARGAYNLFQLRERNGWSGKAAIPDQTVT